MCSVGPNGQGKVHTGLRPDGGIRAMEATARMSCSGKRINEESADKRARDRMFLSFRTPWRFRG